ncbi:hypothetical protein [Psychromonas sp.]|uniref:hypothetical protein n=1 Tax=Psychromonas sp. TaxID=1884585 RepID=UPI00356A6505
MSKLIGRKNTATTGEEDWISVSDLMSALMMIFLLLAVFYMMFLDEENKLQKIDRQEYLAQTAAWESKLESTERALAEQARLLLEADSTSAEKEKLLAEQARLLLEAGTESEEKEKLLAEQARLLSEVDAISAEKEKLLAEQARLLSEADAISAEKEKLLTEQARLISEVGTESEEKEKLLAEQARLLLEAEAKSEEQEKLLAEQARLLSEADAIREEKDKLLAEQARLLLEAEAKREEKDKLLAEANQQLALIKKQNDLKASKFDAVISEAVIYEDVINELRQSLLVEFKPDLEQWNAELRDDLTFRFNEPRTLFSIGDATLTPRFKGILADFFPRYIKVITSDKFRKDITEVRIEGHTSSIWGDLDPNGQQAYFNNMELSQERSKNTLFYVTQLPEAQRHAQWLKSRLTANGLSSSKLVDKNGYFLDDPRSDGRENLRNSQRAEFRVKIDAESKITKIIDSGKIE